VSVLRPARPTVFALTVAFAVALLVAVLPPAALAAANPAPPSATTKLVFIHHSTGEAWLRDDYGYLASTLGANNYFVSDTNYGWGPGAIGDFTDIGHWWTWFRGPSAPTNTAALYANTGINSVYARSLADPGGENTIVMFKSCFPNSAVDGTAVDAVPPISSNPLKGNSGPLTVGNVKGIYLDALEYFKTRPDKLFVLIVSPPLRSADTNASQAANARYLANWLTDPSGYLNGYTAGNVFVFDYYTVLTGGHHHIVGGDVEHTPGPTDYLAFPTGDSHPSAAGDQVASSEFVPMLNAAYNAWKGLPPPTTFPVYRFYNNKNGYYLWSANESEKNDILVYGKSTWTLEGEAYKMNPVTNVDTLYRFRNLKGGYYLYTATETEMNDILTYGKKVWTLEGEAYKVSTTAAGNTTVWRFRNLKNGTYLLTGVDKEKNDILTYGKAVWVLEGPAFYIAP
jgi:hypothetical protein